MPKQNLGMATALAAVLVVGVAFAASPADDAPTVYAATSLTGVLPQVDGRSTSSFGGSNTLQLQIERGAPADLFLSAGPEEAQALYHEGRCERPVTFATNRLVLIVPHGDPARVRSVYGLRKRGLKLSVGNAAVPVGEYTRRLLGRLRLSKVLRSGTVSQQSDVGQVLSQVAFGGADAGFVYATDARAMKLRPIALPDADVRYAAAVVKPSRAARAFVRGLLSPRGRAALLRAGFRKP
jgi:molybdate transport system substrate-binding protein